MHLQIFFFSKQPKNKSTASSCIKRRPEPSALSVSLVVTPSPWGTRPPPFLPIASTFLKPCSPLPSTGLQLYLTSKPPLLLLNTRRCSSCRCLSCCVLVFLNGGCGSQGPKPPFQTTKGNKLYRSPYSTKPRLYFFLTHARACVHPPTHPHIRVFKGSSANRFNRQKFLLFFSLWEFFFFFYGVIFFFLPESVCVCVRACVCARACVCFLCAESQGGSLREDLPSVTSPFKDLPSSRQRQIASRNSSLCYLATPATLHPSLAAGLWKSQVAEPASQPASLPACQPANERIAFQLTTRKIRPLLLPMAR
ncbi:hypothetical protein L345_06004, partial [Ophiophagus hannah]